MNNLRLFTNDKQIDTRASSKLRTGLLKINPLKMNVEVFKFCQYVFLSYSQSLDEPDKCANLEEKEESVMQINTTAHVFDQELLVNVLRYLRSIQSKVLSSGKI